jgi:hypothetical protein
MNQHKYACPYCGQHLEYGDAHCGTRVPCPKCLHPIILPALPGSKMTSSLRLARPIARPEAKFHFNIAGMLQALREFKHWKTVGICLVPFVLVAGAMVAASLSARHPAAPPILPATEAVEPHALESLTELTRADESVREQLAAVNRAFADCQAAEAAEKKRTEMHDVRRASAGPGSSPAADQAARRAQQKLEQKLADARKEFEKVFAQYQKLGGTIDYRQQLP